VLWRTYAVRACRAVANGDGRDTESRIHDRYGRAVGGTQHGTRAYKLGINPPPRYALA